MATKKVARMHPESLQKCVIYNHEYVAWVRNVVQRQRVRDYNHFSLTTTSSRN